MKQLREESQRSKKLAADKEASVGLSLDRARWVKLRGRFFLPANVYRSHEVSCERPD
jgi:hypothetical protein